jgi:ABC-type spermidine/putrescine transport system permease subunit II
MSARVEATVAPPAPAAARAPRITGRRLTALASHAYIWLCLAIFILPFVALLVQSFADYGGSSGFENYRGALGDFRENLIWSVKVTVLALAIDLAVSLPAGYALVRYPIPGRRIVFSVLQLSLYVPGAVIGLALLLTYTFTYHAVSMWGLVLAMAVGTFPLMLTPIVVALKDLPPEFEEAARCLGATGWQTYRKIVFPLIGPGVSAGLLLSFIIVFNEYLVTLFVAPTDLETAPLRIFNLQRTGGLSPGTAALAVTMQLVSFAAVLIFFRAFGTRHFKGTYIL